MRAQLLEAWLLVRKLTLRRLWNALCIYVSYGLTRLLGRVVHWGLPISVGIEPTTACNLRCPQCPSGLRSFTRPTGRLMPQVYDNLIEQLHRDSLYLILYFQGEPYLNPHFLDLVRHAQQRRLYTYTSTNAHFLDDDTARQTVESGLDHLIVSVDGLTQETYSKYRIEGDLQKVITGIYNVVAWKRKLRSLTPFIELQFIVFGHNEHELPQVPTFGRQLGVNRVRIKTAQVYDHTHGHELLPQNEAYSRYTAKDGNTRINNALLNHCWKLWQGAEVTWDGRVLPCCFDKDAQHEMGQLPQQTFLEIWRGGSYQAFRQQLVRGRAQIDICRNCTEGVRVVAG